MAASPTEQTGTWLNAVTSVSATNAWTVGDGGIAYEFDGSAWQPRSVGAGSTNLYAVDFFDAQHGAIVGANGTIRVTRDGGANWRVSTFTPPVGIPLSSITLRSVHMSGPDAIVAGGTYGVVLRTGDDGDTWSVGQAYLDVSHTNYDWQINGVTGTPADPTRLMFAGYGVAGSPTPDGYIFTGIQPALAVVTPDAPTGLTAVASGFVQPGVDLQWTEAAFNETGYRVYRAKDGGSPVLMATLVRVSDFYAPRVERWTDTAVGWSSVYSYSVVAYNAAAESTAASASSGKLDTAPPTTTSDITTGWYNASTAKVTLTAGDTQSGVAETRFQAGAAPQQTGTGPFTVAGEGTSVPVAFGSTDMAGNVETTQNTTMKIDAHAPDTTDDHRASYFAVATITLTPAEPVSGSGVASTSWLLDGVAGTGTTVSTRVLASGHSLYYASTGVPATRKPPSGRSRSRCSVPTRLRPSRPWRLPRRTRSATG